MQNQKCMASACLLRGFCFLLQTASSGLGSLYSSAPSPALPLATGEGEFVPSVTSACCPCNRPMALLCFEDFKVALDRETSGKWGRPSLKGSRE